jgi:hypothetical protein
MESMQGTIVTPPSPMPEQFSNRNIKKATHL